MTLVLSFLISSASSSNDGNDPGKEEYAEIDLAKFTAFLLKHSEAREEVLAKVPSQPVSVGLFAIDCSKTRSLLYKKHTDILLKLLKNHVAHCDRFSVAINKSFLDIFKQLGVSPHTIEELTELQELINTVDKKLDPAAEQIEGLLHNFSVLEKFNCPIPYEVFDHKWRVIGWPKKVLDQIEKTRILIEDRKAKFFKTMKEEQSTFAMTLDILAEEVDTLSKYNSIKQVDEVAEHCVSLEKRIQEATDYVQLICSREVLFNAEVTDYAQLSAIKKAYEPYKQLWSTSAKWLKLHSEWVHGSFLDLNGEEVGQTVDASGVAISKAFRFFKNAEMPACTSICQTIKDQITNFKPHVPMIQSLRNPGMRERHWNKLGNELGIPNFNPDESFTLQKCIQLKFHECAEVIQKVGDMAAKEYQIEKALNEMEALWEPMNLNIISYRNTGTGVLKGVDEIQAVLDEQVTMTQAMQFSSFKGPFEARISEWDSKLFILSEVLDEWMAVQRSWLYLQPIFESPDINKQLPVEGKRFATVDKNWRQTVSSAKAKPKAIDFCSNEKLLQKFQESNKFLDMVQKGLSEYLETKRGAFARFYFLSNDELLSILSETKDVKLVQPHLKKCFEGVNAVNFEDDLKISAMVSQEKEVVPFTTMVDPNHKNVEDWMMEVEHMMKASVRDAMLEAILDYTRIGRIEWMQKHAAMCVLNGSQVHWTQEVEAAIRSGDIQSNLDRQLSQLADMTQLVRGEITNAARTTVGALTVVDVHARDVTQQLVDDRVSSVHEFLWIQQLRYYWEPSAEDKEGDLFAMMVRAKRPYGYEYLGNSFRLVITPLTDKCYMTIMGALEMILGGAPAGPAGTGKTETTKDLAKALAKQCVVFNCSDGLDFIAMGKFFKGLCSCGAWACFDEFNRIDIEVLSVVGQQVLTIQLAIRAGAERLLFEESDIKVDHQFGVFITMNPGYAGRTELPDSLAALFRPVAMMVPDYALIGEIMFYAYGFDKAKICGAKMVTTFKLSSEQLSSQCHYDYGMRAVKTVIVAAGNLKRADPDMDEEILLLRALQDVNLPKFLAHDLPLFEGIIKDIFPGKTRPPIDYGALFSVLKVCTRRLGLQPVPFFMNKCIQLYEMIVIRHGLMLVGPTGGGKSKCNDVLAATLEELNARGEVGHGYEKVKRLQMNPKSITLGQLYGQFDPNTHEWQDGILAVLYRKASSDTRKDLKWVLFNGPVDAIWIENMNTVLDDNKKLCLNSGEMIFMSSQMTMMFEVEDLLVASPATVSRVGVIYMEPHSLGLDCLIQSWVQRLPEAISACVRQHLYALCDRYLSSSLAFLRTHLKELCPSVDNNLAESLTKLVDCFLAKFVPKEGVEPPKEKDYQHLEKDIDNYFLFALIWSLGGTCDTNSRVRFDAFLRSEMVTNCSALPFPAKGQVFDYCFNADTKKWDLWLDTIPEFKLDPKLSFAEIVVPTTDSIRNTFLLQLLVREKKHVLMVGDTGTGKTINIAQFLQQLPQEYVPLTTAFSAQTTANQIQDFLDSKMEKRRKGVFGPSAGKEFVVYVDDLNMPKKETYGAQPPIELLRQWFDQGGWFDRKALVFRKIIDTSFVTSMGPPGGGRNPITPRFLRHFNMIGYAQISDESKQVIFSTILNSFVPNFTPVIQALSQPMVKSTILVYNRVTAELLPTPAKTHYMFNLRDLAKVIQGVLMGNAKSIDTPDKFVRLWVHEAQRVFQDRMTNDIDRHWFKDLLQEMTATEFGLDWSKIYNQERLFFGDYMIPGADNKVYAEVEDISKLQPVIEDSLMDHNAESKSPMPLVMFLDAIEHVSRISRVIRQPQGNMLLLGVGGSGRQSLSRLATFLAGYTLFQVEIVKGYGVPQWREDVKTCLLDAALNDRPVVFLFSDVQVVAELMLEDMNGILNAGDIPNLYAPEDIDAISQACRADCQQKGIPATKLNIFG